MKSNIQKINQKFLQILFEQFDFIGEIGDLVVKDDRDYPRVYELTNIRKGKKIEDSILFLTLIYDEYNEKGTKKTITIKEFQSRYVIFKGTHEELLAEANKILSSTESPEQPTESNSTDLIQFNVANLNVTKKATETKRNQLTASMVTAQQIMNSKVSALQDMKRNMEKQISHINKLLYTLKLYQGIDEETVTLQTGTRANSPQLSIIQQIMYMDIEVGDPTNGGWDLDNIEDFDKWLLEYDKYYKMKNYERLLPFPCSIAAFKVRHSEKHYDPNPFINNLMNEQNDYTYFLFRNGDMLQRYWIDKKIHDRLFPKTDEFEKLAKDVFWNEEDAAKSQFDYKLNFIILQSVVDRLDIYSNFRDKIQFFSPQILQNKTVNFFRNEENTLGSNLPSWREFRKTNTKLKEGSRIYFIKNMQHGDYTYYTKERYYLIYFANDYRVPALPDNGIYTVQYDKEQKVYYIMALPSDEIYTTMEEYRETGVGERPRKKSIRFKIQETDDFIISYDMLYHQELELLNQMMHERQNRYHNSYLKDIPFMKTLYDARKKEIKYESHFIKLLQGHISTLSDKKAEEAILWWKIKNKWKRDLKTDEPKALRMITSKLKKEPHGN